MAFGGPISYLDNPRPGQGFDMNTLSGMMGASPTFRAPNSTALQPGFDEYEASASRFQPDITRTLRDKIRMTNALLRAGQFGAGSPGAGSPEADLVRAQFVPGLHEARYDLGAVNALNTPDRRGLSPDQVLSSDAQRRQQTTLMAGSRLKSLVDIPNEQRTPAQQAEIIRLSQVAGSLNGPPAPPDEAVARSAASASAFNNDLAGSREYAAWKFGRPLAQGLADTATGDYLAATGRGAAIDTGTAGVLASRGEVLKNAIGVNSAAESLRNQPVEQSRARQLAEGAFSGTTAAQGAAVAEARAKQAESERQLALTNMRSEYEKAARATGSSAADIDAATKASGVDLEPWTKSFSSMTDPWHASMLRDGVMNPDNGEGAERAVTNITLGPLKDIQRVARLNPAAAAQMAQYALQRLPNVGPNGDYNFQVDMTTAITGGLSRAARADFIKMQQVEQKANELRATLSKYAGGARNTEAQPPVDQPLGSDEAAAMGRFRNAGIVNRGR